MDAFGPDLEPVLRDLADTLVEVGAIGLTGPHIGLSRRIVAVRDAPGDPVRIYVNPVLAWASPDTETHEEGSVSMPGIRERVERPARIGIAYQDPDGTGREEEASGFAAAVLQHEIDQLTGSSGSGACRGCDANGPSGASRRASGRRRASTCGRCRRREIAVIDWFFRDRRTGRIVIGQWPNLSMWLFAAASVAAWLLRDVAWADRSWALWADVAARLFLAWWAADELLRGVNPWRRCLGAAVLIGLGLRLFV